MRLAIDKRVLPLQMFDELAAQIIANIAVIFLYANPEEILRADIFVDASEIFTLYFGFVFLAPIEPAVLILMIVSVILA